MHDSRGFPRSPALSPNLRNRLKLILIASRVPIAPALLILGDEIANLATLESEREQTKTLLRSAMFPGPLLPRCNLLSPTLHASFGFVRPSAFDLPGLPCKDGRSRASQISAQRLEQRAGCRAELQLLRVRPVRGVWPWRSCLWRLVVRVVQVKFLFP